MTDLESLGDEYFYEVGDMPKMIRHKFPPVHEYEGKWYTPYHPLVMHDISDPIFQPTPYMQNDVAIFMEAGDHKVALGKPPAITPDNIELAELYLKLVNEEALELTVALETHNLLKVADGAGDLIWVTLGLCNALGINIAPVWNEICASNMSKVVNGKLIKREDGKILKPDTYFEPNIARALSL